MRQAAYSGRKLLAICLTLAALVPGGCNPRAASAFDLSAGPISTPTLLPTPAPTYPETPANTATTSETPPAATMESSKILPVPALEVEPLRFTFSTPSSEYVSAWRPPLYPIPWSLSPYDHFYFSRPIAADNVNWPSADYRYGDFFPDKDIVHTGIDIGAERGTSIIAAAAGKVAWAGEGLYRGESAEDDPYGLAVAIRHDFGYEHREVYTIYAHMDRVDVQVGQRVEAGDHLGIVGNTGNTTGPHLHFEVRIKQNSFFSSRNPELWLAPPQGRGVLVGRMIDRYGSPLTRISVRITSLSTNETWVVRTYGPTSVNSDDFYQENLVLSDLPAGEYRADFRVRWKDFSYTLQINPGAITYFDFYERTGVFSDSLPKNDPESLFDPASDESILNPGDTVNP